MVCACAGWPPRDGVRCVELDIATFTVKCDPHDASGSLCGVIVDETKKVHCVKVKESYFDCNKDRKYLEVLPKEANEVHERSKDF